MREHTIGKQPVATKGQNNGAWMHLSDCVAVGITTWKPRHFDNLEEDIDTQTHSHTNVS